jgi:acyl-CoA reductase-like NAD-dependent aldehyde dehydrogenase
MTVTSLNPHDPADVVGGWPTADEAEVAAAVARATAAAREWAGVAAPARAATLGSAASALEARAGEVTELVIREVGKPRSEAAGEVARGVAILRYYAQVALLPDGQTIPASSPGALLMARHRPVGVAALVTPWNFPVAIPLWKAAPSLAFGNATVLKPAGAATGVALLLHEIIAPYLPGDVFQLVLGDAVPGRALADHPDVAAVSFTGSVPVGREVVARVAGRGGRVQAEMGGQNAAIVLADADFGRAAAAIAYAAMGYAGQKCTATSRIIVEDAAYEEFRPYLVDAIARLGVVGPSDGKTLVGPVISERARAFALDAVAASGGRVLAGGTALDEPGYYVAPTLVELESPAGRLATEEVFAPVAALLRAPTPEAAADIANGVRYGLVTSVFTGDLSRALMLTERLDAGMVRVNAPTAGVDFQAPFGGAKESSYGPREQGLAARDFYTETHTITIVP